MRCAVCDDIGNWEDLGYIYSCLGRNLVICKRCGFTTYVELNEEFLRESYRESKNYQDRKLAGTNDFISKLNKLMHHRAFLGDFLATTEKKAILDIGCSTGYLLKMCRDEYGHDDVCGTEWNPVHRAFGSHGYGLDIRQDIEEFGARKFDLVCLLMVLEHVLEPDRYLRKVVDEYLALDGAVYINVPVWFDLLGLPSLLLPELPGMEKMLPKGHINIFSLKNILHIFHKAGLTVIEDNYSYYGYRALLKRCGVAKSPEYDNYTDLVAILSCQKKALELYDKKLYGAAVAVYGRFPQAMVEKIVSDFPDDYEARIVRARAAETLMPNVEWFPWIIGHSCHKLGRHEEAVAAYRQAYALNPALLTALWQLADIHKQSGAYAEAAALYRTILFQRPDFHFKSFEEGKPTGLDLLGFCCSRMFPDGEPGGIGWARSQH